ncbi:glutathionylspermidine synthase family protein [Antribacter gilvus]|uniref:glutathionylspermidine synthase family protein n=1 Tax=Antribacter gilvus TaxID=2304675 RepID=UPI000F7B2790|nr:glutathionylspermidine synthase family protein [Antribacter gilvus]
MRRDLSVPRTGWRDVVAQQGLVYVESPGSPGPCWDESACYTLTLAEVEALEEVTEELHDLCLRAARHVVRQGRLAELGVPEWAHDAVVASFDRDEPSLVGRFDLRYDGVRPAKLLEYNADTPTSLVEAAIVQWYWLQDTHPHLDQWNSLHERLVERWRAVGTASGVGPVHFAWADDNHGEDLMNTSYHAETAVEAGLDVRIVPLHLLGWDGRRFVDDGDEPVDLCFKLYPWEWMLEEPYGRLALDPATPTRWVEPLWKVVLSNKALLAVLWELHPGHPNLLPAYLDGPRDLDRWVTKPLMGREGAGVTFSDRRTVPPTPAWGPPPGQHLPRPADLPGPQAPYTPPTLEGLVVYQEADELPRFGGRHVVLGSWVVADAGGVGRAAGCGFRESDGPVTDAGARFVPHVIQG